MFDSHRILIAVTGGIAAYKVCEVVSTLAQAGHTVRVILSDRAQDFVSPLTFATLSRQPAYTDADFWQPHGRPLHIELGEWAEVLAIAPLTANTLAKLAHGLSDNLLTNTVLASTCPILLAPAMNTDMGEQVAVQRNWELLLTDPRFHVADSSRGRLACDRVGKGRMAEPVQLLAQLESVLYTKGQRDLVGKRILINTGGTREYLDPVRYIGNPSTGKMGVAIAQAALHRGADVTLVHGAIADDLLNLVPTARLVAAPTAEQMHRAMVTYQPEADWLILAAAVADVRPANYHAEKLPKAALPEQLQLTQVPDIAADLAQRKLPGQQIIGFAAQTGEIVAPALEKLNRKGFDLIVANPVDLPGVGFGSDRNQAILLDGKGGEVAIEPCSKLQLAHRILSILPSSFS
jgi:phosphopantothenoylcysteine decarboxylase / phosphopantothenate---cysteine ligase